ncbi:MAG: hypothetical protein JW913_10195 [Chitinispirillaceae bacterium]|nr:hypothetical protein [Chitinispirillaceae bacterium]
MQTIKYGKIAGLVVILMMQTVFAATFTVSQDGRGQFKTIQEGVNAAAMGDEVVILDVAVYKEQVTIDSLHQGLILRSENPQSPNKPTIQYQDRLNIGPTTAAEALDDSTITFDYNGALRLIATAGVHIVGIAIDGGGVYPFGNDGIWEGRYAMQHGNAALVITISGETVIRDCDITNAYFGIFFKDRNEGGVFCNPNPADIDPDNIIPFSAFARTGNHLLEHSRIHDNSVGMFFESSWDMGSTIRYNLIYENHHPTAAMATKVKGITSSEGGNQGGGAFMFKDHLLSPLAIYNNTLWHNSVLFLGNWKSGGQHLIFNNIFAEPDQYWNNSTTTFATSFDMSKIFVNRMHNCVYAAQQQAPTADYTTITTDLRVPSNSDEGASITPFPSSADVRWVETSFLSVNPTAANFLEPDWNNAEVDKYIVDKGWTDAGVKDPDGSRADLGAIPKGGGRPVDVITVRPTVPVEITGSTAKIGFNVTPRIGTMTDLKIVYFGIVTKLDTSDCFGNAYKAITAANVKDITIPAQKIILGSNTIEVTVPATGDFAFLEMIIEGIGSDNQPFTTAVGFIPYRKLDYVLDVLVVDKAGKQKDVVRAGEEVVLNVKARKGSQPFTNKIDPTDVKLQSRFVLLDPAGAPVTSIPGGISTTANVDVVFTRVPLGGVEYVLVSGRWIEPSGGGKVIPFLGSSQGVRVLAGPADSISFQRPASGMTEIINQGETFAATVQAYDMYGNRVDSAYAINCVSTKPDIGIIADSLRDTDTTGLATFRAIVTNGDSGMVFPLVATLVIKPTEIDTAYLMVGSKLDKLIVFYGDTAKYDPTAEIRGCSGIRVPVTIRASKDGGATMSADKTTSFNITFLGGVAAYATEISSERITTSQLVAGQVKIWIQATSKNVSDGQITVTSNEPNVLSGERRDINFDACFTMIKQATYIADNGRGSVDRVEIYYDSALAPTDIPDSIVLYWPGLTGVNSQFRVVKRQDIAQDAADPAHLTVTLPEPFPEGITRYTESGAGLGKTYWWNPATPDAPTVEFSFTIEDGVGPLLKSGLLIERLTAGYDTMIIDFTESVDYLKVQGLSLTLIKGTEQIPLEVIQSQPEQNAQGAPTGRIIVVVADLGANAPREGDSLKITPAGPAVDASGNHAHPLNRPVVLNSRKIAPDILSAVYYDDDGNGMVDRVRLTFNKGVDLGFMGTSFSWQGNSGNAKTENYTPVGMGGDTVDVNIAGLFSPSVLKDKTSGVMNVTVFFSNYETNQTKFKQVEDGAAPVLTEVRYHFGAYLSDSITAADTVFATFSEPLKSPPTVNQTGGQPLLFIDILGNAYSVVDSSVKLQDVASCRFMVKELVPSVVRPANNDSAWINADPAIAETNVIDAAGNVQRVLTNKKVAIKVKRAPFDLKIMIGPNPFNPNGGLQNKVYILIKAKAKVAEETTYKTNLTIYDKVGNVVYKPPEITSTDTCLLEWGGTNRQGRIVGNGTYLAYIKVLYTTKGETAAWSKIEKLGVKQE